MRAPSLATLAALAFLAPPMLAGAQDAPATDPAHPEPLDSGAADGASARDGLRGREATAESREPTLTEAPKLKDLVPADVPPGTAFPSPEVTVVLSIDVSASGAVEAVRVEEGAGEPFDAAAVAAARRFAFEPGRLSTGEAVPVTITFRLRITAPPPPAPAQAAPAARPVRLSGRLLERGTRRPLAGVPVAARAGEEVLARATTDAAGGFALEVPAARFRVVAVPPGHVRLDAGVEAKPGEGREVVYYLESSGGGSETVVRSTPVSREVTTRVLPADEVATVAGTQGDTLKAVLNMPGVARVPFGGAALILRGSSPADSRIFLEGQEIPILYHFGGLRSTFSSRFLDAIEFVPGNFSSEYGRATGGIVDVRVRDPASDMFRGEAGANLYDAGFAVEGPLGKGWSGGAAFHRSYIDVLLPLVLPKDASFSFDTAPRYYDYQFILQHPVGDGGRFRIYYYGSLDKLALLLDQPSPDPKISGAVSARIMFHALQAELDTRVSPRLRQETSLQLRLSQFRTLFGPEFYFDLQAVSGSLRSAWTFEAAPGVAVRAGIDAVVSHAKVSLNTPLPPMEGEPPASPSTSQTIAAKLASDLAQPAAFAELRWVPAPSLTIVPGIRADWYSEIRRWSAAPRLAAFWEAFPDTTLEGAVGLYEQPPSPDQTVKGIGNPDLLPERAVHVSAGVRRRFAEGVEANATLFAKSLDRLVVRNPVAAYDPAAVLYVNDGEGRVYGLELLLRARLDERFFGWLAYTYQRSLRRDGFGRPERPFDFDQPHNLTAVGTWRLSSRWKAGFRFRYTSGNPATPITGSVYDASSGTWVPVYGPVNTDRLPPFHQLDVRVDRIWTFPRWKMSLYVDVQNVYNHGNPEGFTYSYDYSQRTRLTGLPILPILGIEGEW